MLSPWLYFVFLKHGVLFHAKHCQCSSIQQHDPQADAMTTAQIPQVAHCNTTLQQICQKIPFRLNRQEFAIYTGFRKENILDLRIEDIRFHDLTSTGEVDLLIKGGRHELYPLGTAAVNVLKRSIGNRKNGYVFLNPVTGTRYCQVNKTFDRAVRKCGLHINDGTKLRIHDLRHVFATWLHREGVTLDNLRFLMGHKDRSTTDHYTSVDRLGISNVLELIPNLNNMKKNSPDRTAAEGC